MSHRCNISAFLTKIQMEKNAWNTQICSNVLVLPLNSRMIRIFKNTSQKSQNPLKKFDGKRSNLRFEGIKE